MKPNCSILLTNRNIAFLYSQGIACFIHGPSILLAVSRPHSSGVRAVRQGGGIRMPSSCAPTCFSFPQVDDLKAKLAAQEVELKQKNEDADKLIQVVGVETEKVSREKAAADEEKQKVALITQEVQQKQKDCEEDLAKAEPALAAAQAALNTLNKVGLGLPWKAGISAVGSVTAILWPRFGVLC